MKFKTIERTMTSLNIAVRSFKYVATKSCLNVAIFCLHLLKYELLYLFLKMMTLIWQEKVATVRRTRRTKSGSHIPYRVLSYLILTALQLRTRTYSEVGKGCMIGKNKNSGSGEDEDCHKDTDKAETGLMNLAILRPYIVRVLYHHWANEYDSYK